MVCLGTEKAERGVDMRFLIYGALVLALVGIGFGVWRAKKTEKFALLYSAAGFLLVMLLVWWVAPAYRFLQHTPDERVEYVFLFQWEHASETPPLEGEDKAKILDALRETHFSHEYKHNYTMTGQKWYHINLHTDNDWIGVEVCIPTDGSKADVYLGMGDLNSPPWGYRAANPEVLAQAVLEVMEP